jgi:hypothetical protein
MQPAKRLALGNAFGVPGRDLFGKCNRMRDFLRLKYPLKLDFCRLTAEQTIGMMCRILEADKKAPGIYRPIVAIGHSKDLSDISAVETFLAFLRANDVAVSTFEDIYSKLCLTHADTPRIATSFLQK